MGMDVDPAHLDVCVCVLRGKGEIALNLGSAHVGKHDAAGLTFPRQNLRSQCDDIHVSQCWETDTHIREAEPSFLVYWHWPKYLGSGMKLSCIFFQIVMTEDRAFPFRYRKRITTDIMRAA